MIRIAYDVDGDFCVVDGYEEFFDLMDKRGTAEVVDVETGTNYVAHEVGEQILLLNRNAQEALVRLADVLIQEIAAKPLH
jgi:hypothetical protein